MSLESEGIYRNEYLAKIPNFTDFLTNFGDVSIVDYGETERRWGLKNDFELHEGKKMHIYISGIYLGIIEFYEYPTAYVFEGTTPTLRSKTPKGKVHISWSIDNDRTDKWTKIPFP